MDRPFLGKGVSFPLRPAKAGADETAERTGPLEVAAYEESVRQAIWIILGTAKGERVMRPDFGCGIYDLVFEVNSASTAARVAQEIRDALLFHEPRIDVLNIDVQPGGDGEALLISIDYQVRATNNAFNMVYPFYLERSPV
jgi:phage baseplate assembly protein W